MYFITDARVLGYYFKKLIVCFQIWNNILEHVMLI